MNFNFHRKTSVEAYLAVIEPYIAIGLIVFVLFWRQIVLGSFLFGSDFIHQFYPWKKYLHDYVWTHGTLPLWNPFLFSGTPFLANFQTSVFYPAGFLFYLMPAEQAYVYTVILHILLGAWFMYLCVRSFGISSSSALVASMIFAFNGHFMGRLYAGHLSLIQSYIWLPLIIHFFHQFLRHHRYHLAVAAGVAVGIQILAGYPQPAAYSLAALALFGLIHAWSVFKTGWKAALEVIVGLAVTVGVGVSLAAIQLLPTFEMTSLSDRAGGISYAFATIGSLHPKDLITLLVPDLFGNPVDHTYWLSTADRTYWATCAYVGVMPLFLFFIGLQSNRHRLLRLFCIGMTGVSLMLAFGKFNPLYSWIHYLPGFNSFRIPGRILYLYVFGMALLSSIGLDRLKENARLRSGFKLYLACFGALIAVAVLSLHFFPGNFFFFLFRNFAEPMTSGGDPVKVINRIIQSIDRAALLFAASVLIFIAVQTRRVSVRAFSVLIILVVSTDLYLFGGQFVIPFTPPSDLEKTELLANCSRLPTQGRIITHRSSFYPNDGLLYRFPSMEGYDSLIPKRYTEYILKSQGEDFPSDHVVNLSAVFHNPDARLLRFLNLTDIVEADRIRKIEPLLPYVVIVPQATAMSKDKILNEMLDDRFDPRRMVLVETDALPAESMARTEDGFKADCTVVDWKSDRIQINTSANGDGYLVINEMFYPSWQVRVDGRKAPLWRGNYLFCVVPLKAGNHTVLMRFVSWPFRIGAAISLLTAIFVAAFIIRARRGSKHRQ